MVNLDLSTALDRFIEGRRHGKVAKDDIIDRAPGLEDEIGISATGRQTSVEPTGFLEDDEFQTFTEARRESDFLSYNPSTKSNVVVDRKVEDELLCPDPREVHESRSEHAQMMDEKRDATITLNPCTYASDPARYDYPGVDTGPQFRSMFGETLSSQELEKIEKSARGERSSSFDYF